MTTKQSDRLVFIFGLLFIFWFSTYPVVLWYMIEYEFNKLYIVIWGVPGILLIGLPFLGPLIIILILVETVYSHFNDRIPKRLGDHNDF